MDKSVFEGLGEILQRGIKAKGPWGEIETETPAEGIIVAVGIALGLGAVAYGLVKNAMKKVSK